MEARHQGERALFRRRVRQIEDARRPERDRRLNADIPVQVRPGKFLARALRHIEADAVGGDP
jgi:hypothetical protein